MKDETTQDVEDTVQPFDITAVETNVKEAIKETIKVLKEKDKTVLKWVELKMAVKEVYDCDVGSREQALMNLIEKALSDCDAESKISNSSSALISCYSLEREMNDEQDERFYLENDIVLLDPQHTRKCCEIFNNKEELEKFCTRSATDVW